MEGTRGQGGWAIAAVLVFLALVGSAAAQDDASSPGRPRAAQTFLTETPVEGSGLAGIRERAEAAEAAGDLRQSIQSWLRLAEGLEALGDWGSAAPALENARRLADKLGDADLQLRVQLALGNLGLVLAPPEEALNTFERALARAQKLGEPGLIALAYASAGNAHSRLSEAALLESPAREKHDGAALAAYQAAARIAAEEEAKASSGRFASIRARALTNAARTSLSIEGESPAELWEAARPVVARVADPKERAELLLHGARTLERARADSSESEAGAARLEIHSLLSEAHQLAEASGAARINAHALLDLSALYREERRDSEARVLIERVLPMLGKEVDPVLRWRTWVAKARLDRDEGKQDEAIAAYAEALEELDAFRYQRNWSYGQDESVGEEKTQAVHFEYVDLILQRAAEREQSDKSEGDDLALAQRSLERLKVDELRDYFDDECVDAALRQNVEVGEVDPRAALIYPISFDDRIELLVTHAGGRTRRSIPVSKEDLEATANDFRVLLETRTSRRFMRPAQKLYDWLIRPILSDLDGWGIETVVFVHGGALRSAPMAALHDGEKFLIERFAVAITPGLDLTSPERLATTESLALLGGVSEAVEGFQSLPGVGRELQNLSEIIPAKVLLNESFVPRAFERELGNEPYSVVHIASHASFANSEDAFVVSYGGKISIDSLSDYIGLFRTRDQPLELLMLSACETAAGDENAALGLSGVAVKSGARSAVGTLWLVDDEAAQVISSDFYRGLFQDRVSRAKALQRAQRLLLKDRVRRHPYYWAPFVLIGNWL